MPTKQTLLLLLVQLYCWSLSTLATTTPGSTSSVDEVASPVNLLNHVSDTNEAVISVLRSVSEQLERFNTLYVGKLETRMLSVATLLTNIDANVKNLQERAHVWDTFQLHVSAWNEQIKSLDRKVDILNRGQEQLPVLDGKVTQLLAIEEHFTRLLKRADDADSKLSSIARALEDSGGGGGGSNPLGEFAARGALSTLKNIERKVERLGVQLRHVEHHNGGGGNGGGSETSSSGRLVVKCQSPPSLEALLHDVAAKVDVLFDRLPEEGEGELRSGESALLSRVFRRLASPLRRTWRALEGVERAVRGGEETAAALRQAQRDLVTVANRTFAHALQGSECCLAQREAERGWRVEAAAVFHEVRTALHNASLEREQITLHLDELVAEHNASSSCSGSTSFSSDDDSDTSDESESQEDDDLTSSIDDDEDATTRATTPWLCHDVQSDESGVMDKQGNLVDIIERVEVGDSSDLLYCDQTTTGGGWTVIQRRGDYAETSDDRENFTRSWEDYERGFGDMHGEFWAGLKFMHKATYTDTPMRLRIELTDFEGNATFAEYDVFRVAGSKSQYRLRIGGYTGNASDSFGAHNGVPFSTVDRDNDEAPECCPCAPAYGGGWWFYSCFEANLNGEYHSENERNSYFRGIIWEHWRGDYSLASAEMKIRPVEFEPH